MYPRTAGPSFVVRNSRFELGVRAKRNGSLRIPRVEETSTLSIRLPPHGATFLCCCRRLQLVLNSSTFFRISPVTCEV